MTLWRVDVAGISHRYVQAETRAEAVDSVASALVAALDLRVQPADRILANFFEASGPQQKKRLLAVLDGLTPPAGRREARLARRRLARLVRYDAEVRAWVKDTLARLPPVDPEQLAELLGGVELQHIQSVKARLRGLQAEIDNEA
jgi:hypothetical protein